MKIIVNAKPHDVTSGTLDAVLFELGYDSPAIATAVNGDFVPREGRSDAALKEGDRIEVLAPMQGG